ncbi:MAG: hypothetical protein HQK53_01665 [Oligoflexia bacterium]|nr:hypothetical protein [Oligoflexia bacterium]
MLYRLHRSLRSLSLPYLRRTLLVSISIFIIFITGHITGLTGFVHCAYAYNLVKILGISDDQKEFYLQLGEDNGLEQVGVEGTFTNNNVSVVARLMSVSENYSLWRILEPAASVPFAKDQVVTFNNALEKVWMLDPDNYSEYKKKLQWEAKERQRHIVEDNDTRKRVRH